MELFKRVCALRRQVLSLALRASSPVGKKAEACLCSCPNGTTQEKPTEDRRTAGVLPGVFVLGGRWSTDTHPCAFVDWPHSCGHTSCSSHPPITASQGTPVKQRSALQARRSNSDRTALIRRPRRLTFTRRQIADGGSQLHWYTEPGFIAHAPSVSAAAFQSSWAQIKT